MVADWTLLQSIIRFPEKTVRLKISSPGSYSHCRVYMYSVVE